MGANQVRFSSLAAKGVACGTCTCTFRLFLIPIHIAVHIQSLQAGHGARLVEAAAEGDVDLVASLLERGADVNSSKDERGFTPLLAGCRSGSTELVKLLIERGADVNMRAGGASVFITPLCVALSEGHEEVAALLIEHGADVNHALGAETNEGEDTFSATPLVLAAMQGLQHATKLLLERGAEVDKETKMSVDGESISVTALMCAATAEVATLLLDHGAQVDFQGSHGGRTALMGASAQVDLQESGGRTALMCAVVNNEANLVRLLIQRKASIDIQTKRGETALDLAREKGFTDIIELLNNPVSTLAVETPAEVTESESESVACKTTPPEPHDLMTTLSSTLQAQFDTLSNRMDNFDSRLTRVESTGAISNNPAPQQEDPTPPDLDSAPPVLAEAHRILKPLASEWVNIGMYLRIPEHEIKAIKIEERGVLRNCLRELLIVWLRRVAPPPSWRALAEAVGEVDERVAREITDRHTR